MLKLTTLSLLAFTAFSPMAKAQELEILGQGNAVHDQMMAKMAKSLPDLQKFCIQYFRTIPYHPYLVGKLSFTNTMIGTPIHKYGDNYKADMRCEITVNSNTKYSGNFVVWFNQAGQLKTEPMFFYLTDTKEPPVNMKVMEDTLLAFITGAAPMLITDPGKHYIFVENLGITPQGSKRQVWHVIEQATAKEVTKATITFTATPTGVDYLIDL